MTEAKVAERHLREGDHSEETRPGKVKRKQNEIFSAVEKEVLTSPKATPKQSDEEILHTNVEALRQAIINWSRADAAYCNLSEIGDGNQAPPVLEFTVPYQGKPTRLAIDLSKVPGQELSVLTNLLVGPVIADYDEALKQISVTSKRAYDALQRQKEA